MKAFLGMLFVSLSMTSGQLMAQKTHDHSRAGHDHADHGDHDHGGEVIGYQLKDWKESHFDDAKKAEQHFQAVQKLGCEVKKDKHDGHIDVRYRCPEWKQMNVNNHQLADQWQGWLMAAGFDVSHGHTDPAFTSGPEVIEFRLVEWKNIHGNGSPQEAALIATLKKMGCDVKQDQHNGHSDISYRSPVWRDLHFADHKAVEQWESWLKSNGFETKHEH
jgi:hypothetical protein